MALTITRVIQRVGLIPAGWSLKYLEEWFWDQLVYGAISIWAATSFGPETGVLVTFLIMAPISTLMCYWYIKAYDWSGKDWFGFEILKDIRDTSIPLEGMSWQMRLVVWLSRKSDALAFAILSVTQDPFMTTIYLRKKGSRELSSRDKKIFAASVLVSNVYWATRWGLIVYVGSWIWHYVRTFF